MPHRSDVEVMGGSSSDAAGSAQGKVDAALQHGAPLTILTLTSSSDGSCCSKPVNKNCMPLSFACALQVGMLELPKTAPWVSSNLRAGLVVQNPHTSGFQGGVIVRIAQFEPFLRLHMIQKYRAFEASKSTCILLDHYC